jgi:hypothetical protein
MHGKNTRNLPVSIFFSNEQKCHVSFIIFYVFSSTKLENRFCLGGGWHWWEQRDGGERGRRMNMVQIMYTHVCKCKNDTC